LSVVLQLRPVLRWRRLHRPTAGEIVVTGSGRKLQRFDRSEARNRWVLVDVAAADRDRAAPGPETSPKWWSGCRASAYNMNQGEGRYVAVRGVPSELNHYTINGFEIGNPDGNTRRLPTGRDSPGSS
jgi:hypothetical protein